MKRTATTIRREMSPIEIDISEIGQNIADDNNGKLISTSFEISDINDFSGHDSGGRLVPIIAFQICVGAKIKKP